MKYSLFNCTYLSIAFILLSIPVFGQDCFDPTDPDYPTPPCILQRLDSLAEGTAVVGGTTLGPYNCNDGIDNDGDDLIDCQESSCGCTVVPEICNDGIDNDGDGDIDCQDSDCAGNSTYCESDCGNGVDDDGDGFYDYYDGDCLDDPDNPNDYIVNQPDCEAEPLGNVFDITESWSSEVGTASARGLPAVADIDNDGVAEVISFNDHTRTMHILNGYDGSVELKKTYTKGPKTWSFTYPAVGDVDGDDFGEIFHVDKSGKLWAWNHDLTRLWDTDFKKFSVFSGKNGRVPSIADFNLDGVPEVFYVNEIRNAQTGALIVGGSHGQTIAGYTAHNWQTELNGFPVAVDILPDSECAECSGLELVLGHIIYAVDIPGGRLVEVKNMNNEPNKTGYSGDYYPKDPSFYGGFSSQTFSSTAVADYDNDGFLDVICSGATINEGGPATIFLWNLANQEVKAFTASVPANTLQARDQLPGVNNLKGNFRDVTTTPDPSNNTINSCDNGEDCTWIRGVGSLNIANIDADPELECTFMSGSSLFAIDNDWTTKWVNNDDFWESSSGVTGTAVFDFDGDGASEIIYRDEVHLWLVDGFTGEPLNLYDNVNFCSSQTHAEYPIVADVDSDGETELVVVCAEKRNEYGKGPNTGGNNNALGFIRTYKAPNGNYWVPARKIWNQFSYFNVNINDDLSIPRVPQAHHLSFSQICNDPTISSPFSLNKFLNQSPRISYCGNLVFPAPKLDFVGDSTRIFPPTCTNQDFQIRLYFENTGDEEVERPIPVSFYSENPLQSYADTDPDPHFAVAYISIPGGLQPGSSVDTTLTVTGPKGAYTVYASLNDIGPYDSLGNKISNSSFYPLSKINGPVRECDDTPTLVSIDVNPPPFQAVAIKRQDNRNCPGDVSNLNTGEIQVLAPDSTVLQESEYDITWTNFTTGDVVGTTSVVTQLDSGTYVVDINYDNGIYFCQGIADTVRVERLEDWPDSEVVTLELIQPVSSCAPGTADGQARALLNGNEISDTDYLVEWEDEQQAGVLAYGDTATNLIPILYKVTVTNLLTGCSETETIDMTLDLPQIDEVSSTDNTNCKNPNGTITVKMIGGVGAYDYILIQQSPLQDTTFSNNPSFTGLDEGIYEVRAYDPGNDCGLYTGGETVEIITSKTIDDITIEVAKEQTACTFPYTGQLTAVLASGSNYSKYTWTWYRGTVTTGSSAEIVANDYITPDTLSTNLTNIYTVVTEETSSGCTFSESITLTESIVIPSIDPTDLTVLHQTTCEPNGQIQASVGGTINGYQYTLLQGSSVLESNFTGLFTGLEAGPYVVLAEDTATNCVSPSSSIVQIENQIVPFGMVSINETPQTNCSATNPNGGLSISLGGTTAGYSFKWFVGVDTATALTPQPSMPGELVAAPADNYVIRILNNNTGCDTLVYTSISDLSAEFQETVTATVLQDQIYCIPGVFSGEIEAGLLSSVSGGAPDTANYTYYWYQGTKNDVRNATSTLIAGQNSSVITGLDVGWYSVRAVRNDGFGCAALDTAEVFVRDERDFPITDINVAVIEQTSCDSDEQNGGLRGDVSGDTTGYIFNWYELEGGVLIPITTNNPDAVVNGANVDSIGVGTYILEVENALTGCNGQTQVYLDDNIIRGDEIRLNLAASDATNCTPPNGEARITSIDLSEDGGATFTLTDALTNYTYQWYLGDDISDPILLSENATAQSATLESVEPGDYTVLATSLNSTCPSIPYTVTVSSTLINNLSFDFNVIQAQTDCINPNGGLEVNNIVGGSGSYTYQWYQGATLDYPIAGENTTTLSNIRSNQYTIQITDISTGCTLDSTYTLPSSVTPVPPPSLTVTHVDTCVPGNNGEVIGEVDPLILSGIPKYAAYNQDDFFYYWFDGKVEDGAVQFVDPAGDLNDPTNYQTFGPAPTIGDNKRTLSGLTPGWYTVIIVDARNHVLSGGIDPFECQSDPRSFEVRAIAQTPLVVENLNAADSLCAGNSGRSILEITKRASDTTAYSQYQITNSTFAGNPYVINPADLIESHNPADSTSTFTISNLEAGTYNFTFQDLQSFCDTIVTVNISDNRIPPVLASDNVQVNSHQKLCPGNGEAEVIASLTTGVADLANYDFYWHNQVATVSADITDAGVYLGTGTVLSNLDSGIYYVYAVDQVTGCISSYQSIEIDFNITKTEVEITSASPVMNCTPAATGGSITVEARDIDNSGTLTTPSATYSFVWTMHDGSALPGSATVSPPAVNTSTLTNLPVGIYRVAVTNQDIDCETVYAYDTIQFEPVLPEFTATSISKENVTTCNGDGEITVTEIKDGINIINSTDAAFGNYSFTWFEGSKSSAPLLETSNVLSNLSVNTYYVAVTNTSTGNCSSADTLQVVLTDSINNPLIYELDNQDFVACTGINEGLISVRAQEKDGSFSAGGYTFSWTYNGAALPGSVLLDASVSNTETLSNLEAGWYAVIVENLSTGCQVIDSFEVRTQIAIPILTVTKTSDQYNCDPAEGAAEVVDLTLDGSPVALNDYDYLWYTDTPANAFSTTDGYGLAVDSLFANRLPANTYFIKAINPATGCESLPVQISIIDSTESLVVILDNISDPIVACDPTNVDEGSIEIAVLNTADVITRWYSGVGVVNPADSLIGYSNSLEAEDLIPGTYTVMVLDTITNCSTIRTYNVEGVAVPITVSSSSRPFTSCISPNGQVAANANGGSGNYTFEWFDSSGSSVLPGDDPNVATDLESGWYTVEVSDQNELDCAVAEAEVFVPDNRENALSLRVNNDFPVSNCDVIRPNGQLSVSIESEASRYDFFWYEGESISRNPIAQGEIATELPPNVYTVVARDRITGCLSDPATAEVVSEVSDFMLLDPEAVLLSPVTRCVAPDGSAQVLIDSTQLDGNEVLEYRWFDEDGREVFSSTNSNIAKELAVGEYYITVTNLVTGCYSKSVSIEIPEEIHIPDFEIITTPSTCFVASGSATVRFIESFRVTDVEWLTPNGYSTNFFLSDQPSGLYEVTITDDKGCKFTKSAVIESTIYAYNGISPNGDGNNDKFIISCIESFDNNIVQIYNRAGALVYENHHYDNSTSYFEGYGNRGLYIGGEKLPDGTYFYIINKNNGDEPDSGYLELIR